MSTKGKHWTQKKDKEHICLFCGEKFLSGRIDAKYCSKDCGRKASNVRTGHCTYDKKGTLIYKTCAQCGKDFQTDNPRRIFCSRSCKDFVRNKNVYKSKHPNARTMREIHEAKIERERVKAEERKRYVEEMERRKAEKKAERERIKQQNIDYWQNYTAVHTCEICNKDFEAHYPTTKYCSDKCRMKSSKTKRRYKDITVDRGINLYKLARRDNNICQLCGLEVNWNDYSKTETTVVCGNMYPSIDHINPISLGGLHSWDNVQLAHRICNTRKNNRFIG